MTEEQRCHLNITAILDYYNFPPLHLIQAEKDRCIYQWREEFELLLSDLHRTGHFHKNREAVPRFSLEVTLHDAELIELDVDLYNPNYGVWYAIMHFVEMVWPGRTNPFRVAEGLRKRGILPQI